MIRIPVRTVSEANARGHWSKKARRAKQQREAAYLCVSTRLSYPDRVLLRRVGTGAHFVVTMTRISPRGGLDDDNLASSMKAIRDGIAYALGVDDGSDAITWRCAQRKGSPKEYAVEVTVEVSSK